MGVRTAVMLNLFLFLALFALRTRAESSVVFFDSPGQRFIRSGPSEVSGETTILSIQEVAAAVSVLLGFAPPASLSAESSLKLNEVLSPNPFDRPHAVFTLEVGGIEGKLLPVGYSNNQVGSTFSGRVLGLRKAGIQLPDEDEVSVLRLDEPLGVECQADCVNNEFRNLAKWLGGTYVGTVESLDGELNFPLADGSSFSLHIAKKPDQDFALSLVSLIRGLRKAVETHEVFAESSLRPAELLIGRFIGIEALEKEYGSGDIVQKGLELLQAMLIKSFEFLQQPYGAKIVGIIISDNKPNSHSGAILDVKFPTRQTRWLEEVSQSNATNAEVLLVRRSLAWITGVILLVSTLIGVYFLLNMPLTRDTLLYSNVKLD